MRNYEEELEGLIETVGGTHYSFNGLLMQYQRGMTDGSKALDSTQLQLMEKEILSLRKSPPQLAKYFAPQNQKVHPWASYRIGYTDGLAEFVGAYQDSNINPGILALDEGLRGYLRGLRRVKPEVDPGYYRPDDATVITLENSHIRMDINKVVALIPFRDGYGIGFRVGLMKDFDVALMNGQVPKDDLCYEAFLRGLSGQEAAFDLWHAPLLSHQSKAARSYLGGLEVWLRSQGVTESNNTTFQTEIRKFMTPSGLEAFKRGLEGGAKPYWPPKEADANVPQNIWPHWLNLFMAYNAGDKIRQARLQAAS